MQRNILLSYYLTFLRNSYFWFGIWVFYYLRFTNYAGIGFIEAIMYVSLTLSEVPTGAVADLFGKKRTLTIAFTLLVVGMAFLAFATNSTWLIVGVFIAGVGGSFYSGTVDALVFDTLKENAREHTYDKVISRIGSISFIAPAICGIIGGFLYVLSPRLPFILHTIAYVVGLFVTFFLVEPKIERKYTFSIKNFFMQTKDGFNQLFRHHLGFVREQTILLLSIGVIIVVCDEMLNSFLGVAFKFSPTQLAILSSIICVCAALASHGTPYLKKYISYKHLTILVGGLIAISLFISPVVGMIVGGITLIVRACLQAVYTNVSSVLINQTIDSQYRTTTLSTFNLLRNIPYVCLAYFLGSLVDHYSAIRIALALGIILAVFIGIQATLYAKRRLIA